MLPFKFNIIKIEALWGVEEWILSSIKGRESTLVTPYNECNTISDLIFKYQDKIVGKKIFAKYGTSFPLLIKIIKANQKLSLQVHPSKESAQRISKLTSEVSEEKNEMWFILSAKDNSQIISGFTDLFDKQKFVESLNCTCEEDKKYIDDSLQKFVVKRGDYFFTPSGMVHAIGGGVVLLEVQQPSQTTYRLYDYDRVDKDGKKRRLDISSALESLDPFAKSAQRNVFVDSAAKVKMADCEHFKVDYINLNKICRDKCGKSNFYHLDLTRQDSFSLIYVTNGSGRISFNTQDLSISQEGNFYCETISEGELVLLPVALQQVDIESVEDMQFVEIHL